MPAPPIAAEAATPRLWDPQGNDRQWSPSRQDSRLPQPNPVRFRHTGITRYLMLTAFDNETLTQVGPATLMGNLLRRYWMPVLLSNEIAEPNSPPVRARILGEDLVAFRDTSGVPGVFVQACPHRGASLFFGRNEEAGLRCVYHGWKFDTTGACVDMPSEPAESNFKNKVLSLIHI